MNRIPNLLRGLLMALVFGLGTSACVVPGPPPPSYYGYGYGYPGYPAAATTDYCWTFDECYWDGAVGYGAAYDYPYYFGSVGYYGWYGYGGPWYGYGGYGYAYGYGHYGRGRYGGYGRPYPPGRGPNGRGSAMVGRPMARGGFVGGGRGGRGT